MRVKKIAAVIMILLMSFALAACGGAEPVMGQAELSPGASGTLASAAPLTYGNTITFAHADEIYANPDAYKGKAYSGLFQVYSSANQDDGIPAFYANRIKYNGAPDTGYTILAFPDGQVPQMTLDDIVYVQGTIKGKGSFTNNSGKLTDAVIINVTGVERDAAKVSIKSGDKQYTFQNGEYRASSKSLTLYVTEAFFSRDNTVICINTSDSSLAAKQSYHYDVVAHQDGYFTWKFDCRFWMDPSSKNNYDYILLPALDSSKDITLEFTPFDNTGKLLYEPIIINIKMSGLTADSSTPSQAASPTENASPTETVSPTEVLTPTEAASPTETVAASDTPKIS